MKLSVWLCFVVFPALSLPLNGFAYYGARSTEAVLSFEAQADLPWERGAAGLNATRLNAAGTTRTRALSLIDAQVQHLMGIFQSESFRDDFGNPGVIGETYEIHFTSATPAEEAGRVTVTYRFEGKVAFGKDAFRGGETRNIPITLPLAADRIYQQTLNARGTVNLCTDTHYNSEGDFWYFWDPDQAGCPLRGVEGAPLVRLQGKLKRLNNTSSSYPEYDRLYGSNGNGSALEISVFFGYIGDIESTRTPIRRDDAKTAFRFVEKELKARGFAVTETRDQFREYSNGSTRAGINSWRVFERETVALGKPLMVRIKLLLTDTSIDSKDDTFRIHLENAFEHSDIVVYDGHSGLGANLDLASLPPIHFSKTKYQLYFFNGCSSYPYFRGQFFEKKGGSKNVDIITSGLPTFANTSGPNALAFIERFLNGETKTYQKILQELEASNAEMGTYLTGVSGDEDNRWKP